VCNPHSTDGVACNDGHDCTGNDACQAGVCAGQNLPSSTVCRASTGGCDPAETCTGSAPDCPADLKSAAGTVCRASAGVCDVAETCTGASSACPADSKVAAGTVCRAAVAGGCDIAESCDGNGAACPADVVVVAGTVCRASAGACDPAEACTGLSNACPANSLSAAGTVCRASGGVCDVAETCTGASATCPNDAFASAGTVCRASAGVCDVAESCTGSAATCPNDAFASAATVCRAAVNECDVAESCTGLASTCPGDSVKSSATACSSDAISCTADFCNGSVAAPACVHTPSLGCQGNPGTSCLNILNGGGSVGSGVYYVDPDGAGAIAPFQAYCDMSGDGGGWTLALRAQSANSTFKDFYSSYWTDAVLLNSVSNIDPAVDADAKYASFTSVAGTSIRGCLRNTSTGVFACKFYSYGASKTLSTLFSSTPIGSDSTGKGLYFTEATPSSWLTMWGHNTGQLSIAPCYERVGLNVDDDTSCYHARIRFGYMANNECSINTLNDTAGFGASAYGSNVCDGLESTWRTGAGLQSGATTFGTLGGIWVR
jgi:hypothetical protein